MTRVVYDVEVAGHAADFLAVNAFSAGKVAEDLYQLRGVVGLHLVGQQVVAGDWGDLDRVGDRQEIVQVGNFRSRGCLAHSSKSFSSCDRSVCVPPSAGRYGGRLPRQRRPGVEP